MPRVYEVVEMVGKAYFQGADSHDRARPTEDSVLHALGKFQYIRMSSV